MTRLYQNVGKRARCQLQRKPPRSSGRRRRQGGNSCQWRSNSVRISGREIEPCGTVERGKREEGRGEGEKDGKEKEERQSWVDTRGRRRVRSSSIKGGFRPAFQFGPIMPSKEGCMSWSGQPVKGCERERDGSRVREYEPPKKYYIFGEI
jgi:hypothetical protein